MGMLIRLCQFSPKQVHFSLWTLKIELNFNLYYELWVNYNWTQTDFLINTMKTEEANNKRNLDFYVYLSEHWKPVIWNQSECITYQFSNPLETITLLTSQYHTLRCVIQWWSDLPFTLTLGSALWPHMVKGSILYVIFKIALALTNPRLLNRKLRYRLESPLP